MKKCSICNEFKELSEFNNNKSKPDGLQTFCKSCDRKRSREYYKINKDKQKSQIYAAKERRIQKLREWYIDYLLLNPCIDCGERDIVVLEQDHLEDKEFSIAVALQWGLSLNRIKQELDKCETVCANCHRRRTYKRNNSWRINIGK